MHQKMSHRPVPMFSSYSSRIQYTLSNIFTRCLRTMQQIQIDRYATRKPALKTTLRIIYYYTIHCVKQATNQSTLIFHITQILMSSHISTAHSTLCFGILIHIHSVRRNVWIQTNIIQHSEFQGRFVFDDRRARSGVVLLCRMRVYILPFTIRQQSGNAPFVRGPFIILFVLRR